MLFQRYVQKIHFNIKKLSTQFLNAPNRFLDYKWLCVPNFYKALYFSYELNSVASAIEGHALAKKVVAEAILFWSNDLPSYGSIAYHSTVTVQ